MPRPKSSVEDSVFEALEAYTGEDIPFPATLSTLYSVRNAVYKFNKANDRAFRCNVTDDGVTLTERPQKTPHDHAGKAVVEFLAEAKERGDNDVTNLMERIHEILVKHFEATTESGDTDGEESDPPTQRRRRR